jgi:predicted transcriptional regulator
MSEQQQTMISFRIDKDIAEAFKQIAQSNNRNQSILLRDWVIEYVKKHKQTELKF